MNIKLLLILFIISCNVRPISRSPFYKGGKFYNDRAGNLIAIPMEKRHSLFH